MARMGKTSQTTVLLMESKDMNDKGFRKDVLERFYKKDYRPELVIAAYNEGQIFFVKSARSNVWNLPQEGVHVDEGIRDAFLRGWAEELCNINLDEFPTKSYKDMDTRESIKTRIEEEYFGRKPKYSVLYNKEVITPGRSRGGFKEGKKYYFVAVECTENSQDSIKKLYEELNPDETADIEWVNLVEARILMISSGVAFEKRPIVEEALKRLKKEKKIK